MGCSFTETSVGKFKEGSNLWGIMYHVDLRGAVIFNWHFLLLVYVRGESLP